MASHAGPATRATSARGSMAGRALSSGRIDSTSSYIADPLLKLATKMDKLGLVTSRLVDVTGDEESKALLKDYNIV